MKITLDVKRCEQSYDIDSGTTQNFFVVLYLGTEIKVPCTEEQLGRTIQMASAQRSTAAYQAPMAEPEEEPEEEEPVEMERDETVPALTGPLFVTPEPVVAPAVVSAAKSRQVALRPVARPVVKQGGADDAGISQG